MWLIIVGIAGGVIYTLVKRPFSDKFTVLRPLGFLVLMTVGLSTLVGAINYASSAQAYFGFHSRQVYTNVLPGEPAASHYDAGMLIFSQGAGVDHTKAVGYKHRGRVYCAAPVLDNTQMARVEYFAVGVDCCGARGQFTCGDANDFYAKGAIVQREASSWSGMTDYEGYQAAVDLAAAAHGLAAAERPLFVKWVSDAFETRDALWTTALSVALVSSAIFLFFGILGAVAANAYWRKDKQRSSGVPDVPVSADEDDAASVPLSP